MTAQAHSVFDAQTGRPLEGEVEAVETLTNAELEREITIAALATWRSHRFETLLAERRRRLAKSGTQVTFHA
jgi:hypothetical protein